MRARQIAVADYMQLEWSSATAAPAAVQAKRRGNLLRKQLIDGAAARNCHRCLLGLQEGGGDVAEAAGRAHRGTRKLSTRRGLSLQTKRKGRAGQYVLLRWQLQIAVR